jgi:hypothetical protein
VRIALDTIHASAELIRCLTHALVVRGSPKEPKNWEKIPVKLRVDVLKLIS